MADAFNEISDQMLCDTLIHFFDETFPDEATKQQINEIKDVLNRLRKKSGKNVEVDRIIALDFFNIMYEYIRHKFIEYTPAFKHRNLDADRLYYGYIKLISHESFQNLSRRDHVIHSVRVFLLGMYLLKRFKEEGISIENLRREHMSFHSHLLETIALQSQITDAVDNELIKEIKRNLYLNRLYQTNYEAFFTASWLIAAWGHDIGYSLPLQNISSLGEDFLDLLRRIVGPTTELIRPDHGASSAAILQPNMLISKIASELNSIMNFIKNNVATNGFNAILVADRVSFYLFLLEAYISIVLHTIPVTLFFSPLTMFLIMSDTAQEWNRWKDIAGDATVQNRRVCISVNVSPRSVTLTEILIRLERGAGRKKFVDILNSKFFPQRTTEELQRIRNPLLGYYINNFEFKLIICDEGEENGVCNKSDKECDNIELNPQTLYQ